MKHQKKYILTFIVFNFLFLSSKSLAQKVNQFDKNNKRTGVWKKYYSNKNIRYSGQFKNGKEVGAFLFYSIKSPTQPTAVKQFNEQNDSVFVQFFTLAGKLESKGKMIGKKRVGDWVYFFPNGKILSKEQYKNGKIDGEMVIFYPNGKLTEKTLYKNGLKDGKSQKYSSDGVLIEETHYQKGQLNGVAKFFELNGNLKEIGVFKIGKRFGKWEFYMDGEVSSEKEKKAKKAKFKKNEY